MPLLDRGVVARQPLVGEEMSLSRSGRSTRGPWRAGSARGFRRRSGWRSRAFSVRGSSILSRRGGYSTPMPAETREPARAPAGPRRACRGRVPHGHLAHRPRTSPRPRSSPASRARLRLRDPRLRALASSCSSRRRVSRPPRRAPDLGVPAACRPRPALVALVLPRASSSTSATSPAADSPSGCLVAPAAGASACCAVALVPAAPARRPRPRRGLARARHGDDRGDSRGRRGRASRRRRCPRRGRAPLRRRRAAGADPPRRHRGRLHTVLRRAPPARRRPARARGGARRLAQRRARRGGDRGHARPVLPRRPRCRVARRGARSGEPAGECLPARGGGVGLPALRPRALVGRPHLDRRLHVHVGVVRRAHGRASRGGAGSR